MSELSDYVLGEPSLAAQLSNHVVGLTASNSEPQLVVVADYFNPEFRIHEVDPKSPSALKVSKVIGNSPKATFDGGKYARLWDLQGARAQVGQVSNDGTTLLYLENGGRHIGRLDLSSDTEIILPAVGPIRNERAEYFLQLRDGLIATIENYQDAMLRTYEVQGNQLYLVDETSLGMSFVYGLCQDNSDELMFVVPEKGTYPADSNGKPGVYRITVLNGIFQGQAEIDQRFQGKMPKDVRGLAAVLDKGEVKGFMASTYGFDRMRTDMGDPSKLYFIPAAKR